MADDLTIQRLRSLMESPGMGRKPEISPAESSGTSQVGPGAESKDAPSFAETLKQSISEVNELNLEADQAMRDFAAGQTEDIQGTITAIQKADVSFKLMMEVRNKLVTAYKEVMQTQV
ncbi:MAG: flagellar hook-basal body complex protein FliE [Candidatus Sumerlaeia bacterium]